MGTGPAARIGDMVLHLLPGVLVPGPPAVNVLIGFKPAWKGVPAAAAAAMQVAKDASDLRLEIANKATLASAGTPAYAGLKATEEALKVTEAAAMAATITGMSGGASIHMCVHIFPIPLPPPPHGPGVVIDGSPTVLINGMQACRMTDTILEAFGPPDKIMMGEPTVIIGNAGHPEQVVPFAPVPVVLSPLKGAKGSGLDGKSKAMEAPPPSKEPPQAAKAPIEKQKRAAEAKAEELAREKAEEISRAIEKKMASLNHDDKFAAETAKFLGSDVQEFSKKIKDKAGQAIGEIDIETLQAIIETATAYDIDKYIQIAKKINDVRMNPSQKTVMVLASAISPEKAAELEAMGAEVLRKKEEVKARLDQMKKKEAEAQKAIEDAKKKKAEAEKAVADAKKSANEAKSEAQALKDSMKKGPFS